VAFIGIKNSLIESPLIRVVVNNNSPNGDCEFSDQFTNIWNDLANEGSLNILELITGMVECEFELPLVIELFNKFSKI